MALDIVSVMEMGWLVLGIVIALVSVGGYLGVVTGALPIDVNRGRRLRPLGPQTIDVTASRELVFEIIAAPYMTRQPRAMQEKIKVLERGSDMVLAAHHTPVRGRLIATTTETVRFTRPERVDFRLVRGPVPHVVETFELTEADGVTTLTYTGELGTDFWAVGAWWGGKVAKKWEAAVAGALSSIKTEAERRTKA